MLVWRHTAERDPAKIKATIATAARVLAGIDISNNRHEVLIAVPGKSRRRRITVLNTAHDYRRLIGILRSFDLPAKIGLNGQGIGLPATITGR